MWELWSFPQIAEMVSSLFLLGTTLEASKLWPVTQFGHPETIFLLCLSSAEWSGTSCCSVSVPQCGLKQLGETSQCNKKQVLIALLVNSRSSFKGRFNTAECLKRED